MTKIKEFAKDITISVPFKTSRIGFGGQHLTYFGNKTGNSKDTQKKQIMNQIRQNISELEEALTKLELGECEVWNKKVELGE